jgi:alkylation response protein AidB-like acyl-CoA dehydrogenase
MDFSYGADVEAFREQVREFLAAELTPELEERIYRTGVSHDDGFVRKLAARGWAAPDWPRDGIEPLGPWQIHVLTEEWTKVEAPIVASSTTMMVARVIAATGTPEMQADVLPRVLAGEVTIALGMTEPDAGSDVAAVVSRARRDGADWVIDGQKMFTTNGHLADYVFLLVRTDPAERRHRGLSTFLLPLDLPGIEYQAVHTLSGERTNIMFFNDVRVADQWRIGAVDEGWAGLMLALQDEHSAPFSPHLARLLDAVESWAAEGDGEARPIEQADARVRLARWATRLEVAQLLEQRVTWIESRDEVPLAEGPMAKLFSTEAVVQGAEDLAELVGPDALRSKLDPTAIGTGTIEHALRFSLGTTIYGGTSEIQRNIIAQHACGLPR